MCPGLCTRTGWMPILYSSEAKSTEPSTQFACCDAILWSMSGSSSRSAGCERHGGGYKGRDRHGPGIGLHRERSRRPIGCAGAKISGPLHRRSSIRFSLDFGNITVGSSGTASVTLANASNKGKTMIDPIDHARAQCLNRNQQLRIVPGPGAELHDHRHFRAGTERIDPRSLILGSKR